jgi:uncharacterized LabA/DUF88 family protein
MALRRAVIYIDGRNTHHAFKAKKIDAVSFNYRGWLEKVVQVRDIVEMKYYGAKYPAEISLEKHNRDDAFFQHLTRKQQITVIEGRFRYNRTDEGKPDWSNLEVQEKGVDVRLAVDLVVDAFYNRYDDAYFVSSDTDLIPAVQQAKLAVASRVRIFRIGFSKSAGWDEVCDGHIPIHGNVLKKFGNHPVEPTLAALKGLESKYSKR